MVASSFITLMTGRLWPQADLKVVRVVRRGDLDDAGAEVHLDIVVADNRNLAANQRQDDRLADQVLVALVLRVDGNGGIAEHRFRAGGGQLEIAAAVRERVAQVPEVTGLLLDTPPRRPRWRSCSGGTS